MDILGFLYELRATIDKLIAVVEKSKVTSGELDSNTLKVHVRDTIETKDQVR